MCLYNHAAPPPLATPHRLPAGPPAGAPLNLRKVPSGEPARRLLPMAGLSDLDFGPGVSFEKLVFQRFGCTVSPVSSLSPASFHLVASFGRSALRLNVVSVGTILKSCLGGSAEDFNVIHLSGWMFKFSISSKNVGILIRKTNHVICNSFAIFFFLWGNGGPNWRRDYQRWLEEEEASWTLVQNRSGRRSFADVVKSPPMLKPPSAVLKRLRYPLNHVSNYQDDLLVFSQLSSSSHPRVARPKITIRAKNTAKTVTTKFSLHPLSNSNLKSGKRTSRPRLRWKPISSGPLPSSERGILGPPPNPVQGPLNRCRRCLSLGHDNLECNSQARCSLCYRYGHSDFSCKARANQLRVFRLVSSREGEAPAPLSIKTSAPASNAAPSILTTPAPPPSTVSPPPSSSPMANFAVDPAPFIPVGFLLERTQPNTLLRHEVCLTGCYNKTNEEMAIVILTPSVHKGDFV